MRTHLSRALRSLDKLDGEQLNALVQDLARGNEQLENVLSSIPEGWWLSIRMTR